MKINTINTEKVNSAIIEVEGRVTARTTTADDIKGLVEDIEKQLSSLLNKKDWKGLKFRCDDIAQSFPSSYKYSPESIHVVLERGAAGWFITELHRSFCNGPTQRIIPTNISSKKEELAHFVSQSKNW